MQVKDIMLSSKAGRKEPSVNQEESIDNAAILMRDNNLKEISVVDDNNRAIGKITRDAIIKASDELNEDFFLD